MTPFNFEFYSGLYIGDGPGKVITVEFWSMVKTVFSILILPLTAGLLFAAKMPNITHKISKPVRQISFLILVIFMVVAFSKNVDVFTAYYQHILVLVLIHNGLSFLVGYSTGKLVRVPQKDIRTITIETGIQNSGLSLVLIFSIFNGNGGMALLAAWWGIWHILSGSTISYFFNRFNH